MKNETPLMRSKMEFCCSNCFYFRADQTEMKCESRHRAIRWNPQNFICSQYGTTKTGGVDYPHTLPLTMFR